MLTLYLTMHSLAMTMISDLKICSISDIHLGHPNTPASFIIRNLNQYFLNNERVKTCDIIFIAGDFWDRLRTMRDLDSSEILLWVSKLVKFCSLNEITLRILDGTSSHDYAQSMHFNTIVNALSLPIDIRYIDTLCIEYIEKFDINVLYIPDEWKSDHNNTWLDVQECLASNNLNKVDFAVMHGLFDLQISDNLDIPSHSSKLYKSIVNHLVFIGHDHTHQMHDNIIVHGSFDRLSHGYEDPKGWVYAHVTRKKWTATFVVNEGAMIYKTIDCRTLESSGILDHIRADVVKLPDDSHVRLKLASNLKDIKPAALSKLYPNIRWSVVYEKITKPTVSMVKERIMSSKGITPNELFGIVENKIANKNHPPEVVHRALSILKQEIENVSVGNIK